MGTETISLAVSRVRVTNLPKDVVPLLITILSSSESVHTIREYWLYVGSAVDVWYGEVFEEADIHGFFELSYKC